MRFIIYFVLVILTLVLFTLSFVNPWAVGESFIVDKIIYAYEEPILYTPIAISVAIVCFLLYLILHYRKKWFLSGLLGLVTGIFVVVSGGYFWERIQDRDVYFVLKFVEVKPAIGVIYYILAGGVITAISLTYLFDMLAQAVMPKPKKRRN
ncbi:MAG: hypothetical protein HY762_02510 [Planctomycetes bacterium]|nr:hypothetical protein [Planctomycetota bacterium]